MATLKFRHGIVRTQNNHSNQPNFLQKSGGGAFVDLVVSPDPTIFTIAHYDEDYLLTENASVPHAWGPFVGGADYWLYWDVDFLTAEITRGYTLVQPIDDPNKPSNPVIDQHWFDMNNKIMKVWNGSSWTEKLRVFACKYQQGSTIVYQPLGSQVGLNGITVYAGSILFDNEHKPIKKFRRDRKGMFITTESPLSSQFSRISSYIIETVVNQGTATENMGIYQPVTWTSYGKLSLARNTLPHFPAIGISSEPMDVGETKAFINKGFVQYDLWEWDEPPGTPLYVSSNGQLTLIPPQTFSIQHMGHIVDHNTIFVDPKQIILLNGFGNLTPIHLDKATGRLITRDVGLSGVNYSPCFGYKHIQAIPSVEWVIDHNGDTNNVLVKIYDEFNMEILPDSINIINENQITVNFLTPQIGTAIIVLFV
jgi:hypothetical protein